MGSRHAGATVRPRGREVAPSSGTQPSVSPSSGSPSSVSPSSGSPSSGSWPAALPAAPAAVARRRPAALLAALVVGATVALVGTQTLPAADARESVEVAELLGSDAEGLLEIEPTPQLAITEVEARARLEEVAASRAERADRVAKEQAAAAEAAEAAAEAARPKASPPVKGARLTSCFCPRWGTMHWGIDLAAPMLTPEYAVEDGVVLRAGAASGYGLVVYILGVSGDVTVYGHMEKITVAAGDVVSAGDQIALLGSRGQSTGPHLHFEVHSGGVDGKRVDPVVWLRARGVEL
ncbi:M23 family metallopeptidase [Modestobacter sp. VKM Ac-2984]|uniref:M23 family metallopeptidase n=1 Tax=Modestobacter sp. VKM Ac-2984 TaxID=3004138 RepID=UPI0022AA3FC8|nr:M23 family metallopeptidase [Modestobacter sp. VKM Ac-2984]MCZ2818508.1 M23 family metallopeptidase [Modestobacter sp. VKM Ac-2984]